MKIRMPAPEFTLQSDSGERISLSDFRGKWVAVYFYPKDDTPGCTAEACNLRDNHELLQKGGIVVLGISKDNSVSHQKFKEKHQLPFLLLVDDQKVCEQYGAWGEKELYGKRYTGILRKTFLIDPNGDITAVIEKVDVENHARQILAMLAEVTKL